MRSSTIPDPKDVTEHSSRRPSPFRSQRKTLHTGIPENSTVSFPSSTAQTRSAVQRKVTPGYSGSPVSMLSSQGMSSPKPSLKSSHTSAGGPSGPPPSSATWQDTRLPQKMHTENTKIKKGSGGRFLGPDIILRIRISVSFADPDRGVEKGVRGIFSFILCSFQEMTRSISSGVKSCQTTFSLDACS